MNMSLARKPAGALWPDETSHEDKPRRLTIAIVAALVIESALVGTALSVHVPTPEAKPPAPVMRIRFAQVDTPPPPPPPPPPVVKKVVRHESELPTPSHVQRPVAPKPKPVPVPVKTPTPPVDTQQAPAPVQAAPSMSTAESALTAAPAAPSAAAPAEPADMAIVCPVQAKPEMPARAVAEGIVGSVTARATIRGGKITHVDIVSSTPPGVFDASVRRAMSQYQCKVDGADEVVVEQTFDFAETD
jgi:periplasmic protein TonB